MAASFFQICFQAWSYHKVLIRFQIIKLVPKITILCKPIALEVRIQFVTLPTRAYVDLL